MTPIVEPHRTHGQYTGHSADCSDAHADCRKPMPETGAGQPVHPGVPAGRRRDAGSDRRRTVGSSSGERCRNLTLAPVAAQVPLAAGGIGENSRSPGFVDQAMKRFDDRGLSYPACTWSTWDCSTGPSLSSDHDGTPTVYGIGPRDHPRALNG
ncbi:hypothetical protein ACF05L_29690 [Streptomyces bobili]|uniref:hypothetical protein n=1 Tax=Streptomyces bobili TaxID=67280 RepID=UPI0036F4F1FB